MRINASAGRSKDDLRDRCWSMSLKADDAEDAALLAAIYRRALGVQLADLSEPQRVALRLLAGIDSSETTGVTTP